MESLSFSLNKTGALLFTVGFRASTWPHPVSCGGLKPSAARQSTPTSTRPFRAPVSFEPLESSPGSSSKPTKESTLIRPPTSLDLWPPGEMMSDCDYGGLYLQCLICLWVLVHNECHSLSKSCSDCFMLNNLMSGFWNEVMFWHLSLIAVTSTGGWRSIWSLLVMESS